MTANFNVTRFESYFDDQGRSPDRHGLAVEWSEERNTVVYTTRLFRLAASVEVTIDSAEQYEIGFIQTCVRNFQSNYYTSGATQRWEFDGNLNAPVNDSDSDDSVPWYNINTARTVVVGPTTRRVVSVEMNDNFTPTVSCTETGAPTSYLYRIVRDQDFSIWLVAHKSGSSEYTPLRFLGWRIPVDIAFTQELSAITGQPTVRKMNYTNWLDRSGPVATWQPTNPPPIDPEAFRGPHWRGIRANAISALYRYPADGSGKQFVTWAG